MIFAPGTAKTVETIYFLIYEFSFKFLVFNIKCAQGASLVHTASHLQEACWALHINIAALFLWHVRLTCKCSTAILKGF